MVRHLIVRPQVDQGLYSDARVDKRALNLRVHRVDLHHGLLRVDQLLDPDRRYRVLVSHLLHHLEDY